MSFTPTPSQTVGPFFHIGTQKLERRNLAPSSSPSDSITIRGRVLDGDRAGIGDAMLEIWQADSAGRFPAPATSAAGAEQNQFNGFGRIHTGAGGSFEFTTIKPGRVPGPQGILQAPHIVVSIFSRGLLKPLISRIYFPDEPGNEEDRVLNLAPADRRATLIARQVPGALNIFEWSVILQGDEETVFFDC